MKTRFEIVRTLRAKLREGWQEGAAPARKTGDPERFTMKPGEVTIHRGGVEIPDDSRGD